MGLVLQNILIDPFVPSSSSDESKIRLTTNSPKKFEEDHDSYAIQQQIDVLEQHDCPVSQDCTLIHGRWCFNDVPGSD